MNFEEVNLIDAPTDAEFWGAAVGATLLTVGIGLLFIS